jgi:hypothetical protein
MDFSISVLFICSLVTHLVTEFSAYLSLMVRGAKSRRERRGERAHASRLCTTRSSDRCGAITDGALGWTPGQEWPLTLELEDVNSRGFLLRYGL